MLLHLYTRVQTAWFSVRARMEDERGVIATEYIILLVLIALALVTGAGALGIAINNKLKATGSSVTTVVP
jgi:Flp pilus assembly pilin Flp